MKINKTVSLETAKLLVEKGIVLKTKERCIKWSVEDVILGRKNKLNIPRPDIPELLAELPDVIRLDKNAYVLRIEFERAIDWTMFKVFYVDEVDDWVFNLFTSRELVEALAQALIWVKERGNDMRGQVTDSTVILPVK